jgi:multidrug efflux pump subunit AcrA (membrane-fusion protein)
VSTPIDAAALAQARERLEVMAQYTLANTKRQPESVQVERADLRLVLDALREARRQAFEEMAAHFEGMGWSRPMGGYDAAQLVRGFAEVERSQSHKEQA